MKINNNEIAILFDLDGTLIDTNELVIKSFINTFKVFKPDYNITNSELLSFLGPPLNTTFSKYFDDSKLNVIIDYYRDFTKKNHDKYVKIYPNVKETISELHRSGYKLGIVTTKLKKIAYLSLELFDLTEYFDIIIDCNDVLNNKPDPEGILKAKDYLQSKLTVYIGDNASDILAGKNANVKTIGAGWSIKGIETLKKENPDFILNDMNELIQYIQKIKEEYNVNRSTNFTNY